MGVTSLFPPFTNIRFSVKKKSGSIHTDSRSGHVWSVANTAPYTSFSRLAGHRTRFFGTFFLLDRGLIFGNGHVACRSESQWFSGCFFEASQTSSGKIFTRTALKKYDASTRAGTANGTRTWIATGRWKWHVAISSRCCRRSSSSLAVCSCQSSGILWCLDVENRLLVLLSGCCKTSLFVVSPENLVRWKMIHLGPTCPEG